MFKWLTHRSFGLNLLAAILLIVLIAFVFFKSLGSLTRHGEKIKVPDITHQKVNQIKKGLLSKGLKVVVEDSAYTDTLPPFTIIEQKPRGGSIVKKGRTVYVTLNKRVPPAVSMPDLVNYTLRSAKMTLETYKLKLGKKIYKPDIAKNAILGQLYNGHTIEPGTEVPQGSKITLIVGKGLSDVTNTVPDLVGLTYVQALDLISANDLQEGAVLYDGDIEDTMSAFVYKQRPAVRSDEGDLNRIRAGSSIDLWISQEIPGDTAQSGGNDEVMP